MRFQNGFNKVVTELSGVQFWSEITRMIKRSDDTEFKQFLTHMVVQSTRMISDQIALHSVQVPL